MKVIVDDMAIEYLSEGEGPTVLLLHGWMNDLHNFDALTNALRSKYRIMRLDLPGFGGSEVPPLSWHVEDYARFVQSFIKKIGLHEYVLAGHSFGGRITIKGVAKGLLRPTHIILIDSAGVARRRTTRNVIFTVIAKLGKFLTIIPPFSFFRQRLRKKLYSLLGSDYFAAGALSSVYLNVVGEDLSEYASQISLPTLLIWGSEDRSTPLIEAQRLLSLLKNARLEVIEGLGHAPHQEMPEEVARRIREFI